MVAFADPKGLAYVSITTISSIACTDASSDRRFFQPIDDPKGNALELRAKQLLVVPIIDKPDDVSDSLVLPRGVIVAVNRAGGKSFTNTDMENLNVYASMAATAIELIS
jgi:hypothetical protein